MTFLSLIPYSTRKVQSIPGLPFAQKKNMASANQTPSVIHLHDALAVSQLLLSDAPGTGFKTAWSKIHSASQWQAGKPRSFHRSTYALFMRQNKNFARGSTAPDNQRFFISLKAVSWTPTSTLQYPTGHRQSHIAEVPDQKTALDFAPGSI